MTTADISGTGAAVSCSYDGFVVGALRLGAPFDDRVGDLGDHQFHGPDGVVVAGDRIIDHIRIAVGVDHGDDRNLQLAGFLDGDLFFLRIDDEERVGQAVHVFDAAQEALELIQLVGQLGDFFLGEHVEGALIAHPFEFAQTRDALLNRGEVGEHAAQPALVHEVCARTERLFLDRVLRLLLGADEQHDFAVARHLPDGGVDLAQAQHRLLQIDDVDAVALLEDVGLHLGVPPAGLMAEVDARLQEILHCNNRSHVNTNLSGPGNPRIHASQPVGTINARTSCRAR